MGTTVPGGRYLTADGRLVNADGVPLAPSAAAPAAEPEPVEVAPVAKPRARAARSK